jgi:hypothetical protein
VAERREIGKTVTAKRASPLPAAASGNQDPLASGAKTALYDLLAMVLHEMRAPLGTLTVTAEILDGNLDEMGSVETHAMRYFFPQELALFLTYARFRLRHFCEFGALERAPDETTWNVLAIAEAVE